MKQSILSRIWQIIVLLIVLSGILYSCSKDEDNGSGVTGVSLSQTTLSLATGASGTLTAAVKSTATADTTVTWSSSNTSIATVSNGVVTRVAAGSATITGTTTNGDYTATCLVTVTGSSSSSGSYS